MFFLRPVGCDDKNLFQDTSYAAVPSDSMDIMLAESLAKRHNGRYFELFFVMDGKTCVGVISLYEPSDGAISCGPKIKPQYRRQGFGYAAVNAALQYAKELGYTKAVAQIRQDNTASITLHAKLGFSLQRVFVNKKGNPVSEFAKIL